MSITIVNQETIEVIDMALNNVGIEEVPAWPGVRFDSGSQGYLALMGKYTSNLCLVTLLCKRFHSLLTCIARVAKWPRHRLLSHSTQEADG